MLKTLNGLLAIWLVLAPQGSTGVTDDATKFLEAIRSHDAIGMDQLLRQGASRELLDALLQSAIERDDVAIVQLLLKYGANPNAWTGGPAETPLLTAARIGSWEITELLLGARANPNGRGGIPDRTRYPLQTAASYGHRRVVAVLLSAGADPNARLSPVGQGQRVMRDQGPTALMEAARWGDREMVEMLLRSGANPGTADENGRRAIDYLTDHEKDVARIRSLLKH
jgi:ankyrin repeat protein